MLLHVSQAGISRIDAMYFINYYVVIWCVTVVVSVDSMIPDYATRSSGTTMVLMACKYPSWENNNNTQTSIIMRFDVNGTFVVDRTNTSTGLHTPIESGVWLPDGPMVSKMSTSERMGVFTFDGTYAPLVIQNGTMVTTITGDPSPQRVLCIWSR